MTVFGDAEAAIVDVLADSGRLDPATRISTNLIGYSDDQLWVRVTRTGGVPTLWMQLDNPVMDIAAYAPDKALAIDMANAARAAIHSGRGYQGHGLALYDVGDVAGLSWSPDADVPNAARYLFTVSLVTKPIGEVDVP